MKVETFAAPFRHWLIEGLLAPALLTEAHKTLPGPEWSRWVHYDNDCERRKRTARALDFNMPYCPPGSPQVLLLDELQREQFAHTLAVLTDVPQLQTDPEMHGGGIHITDPGGSLSCHLDYALHPTLALERRINLVLFLNPEWREEWGGAFEMYDDAARECVKRIYPAFNRAVVWEAGDLAYHGTGHVEPYNDSRAANNPPRVTAAVYFLAPPRPHCVRRRALFVPRR